MVGKSTGIRAGGWDLCAQRTAIAFGYGIAGNVAFAAAELRTVGLISESAERKIGAVTVS